MRIYFGVPPYSTKGEPLIEAWSPWGSADARRGRVSVYGFCLRLPFGRTLTMLGHEVRT